MKAVLYQGQEKGVTIGEAEKPTPGPNDLLVKIKCSSLCHSDLMLLEGKAFQDELPRIPGHEGMCLDYLQATNNYGITDRFPSSMWLR